MSLEEELLVENMINKTTDIDILKEQRKLIDQRIKELKDNGITVDGAKLGVEHYVSGDDRWYVAVACDVFMSMKNKKQYKTVINAESKADAIKKIPDVIRDLKRLYDTVIGEQDGN